MRTPFTEFCSNKNYSIESAKKAGVQVITKTGRTLWDPDAIVRANNNKPTMTLAQLQTAGSKLGPIPKPLPAPSTLPSPGPMPLESLHNEHAHPPTDPDHNARWRKLKDTGYLHLDGPNHDFAPPATPSELGFLPKNPTTPHRGGESRALARLDAVMADTTYAATFRKPQTAPTALFDEENDEQPATTLLSPALHFGALSVRLFYHRADEACRNFNSKKGQKASSPPESLTGQLLFRDMYFAAQAALGHHMAQTVGNPQVRYIPWYLPSKLDDKNNSQLAIPGAYHVDSARANLWLHRWTTATTGFPWIDALMRQLRATGWVHHLGRHALACFLTRGGCWVHWERGAEVFADLLLDHEPACNAGNWQWLSCTAFFSQYFRCYSPVSFPTKWDPRGEFVGKWCPELKGLVGGKYVYEPWKAPAAELKRAGVRLVEGPAVGEEATMEEGTYPKPMFDFAERRTACLAAMKKAYDVGLRGDDPKVLDGTAAQLFQDDNDNDDGDGDDQLEAEEKFSKTTTKNGKKRVANGPMDRHVKKTKK